MIKVILLCVVAALAAAQDCFAVITYHVDFPYTNGTDVSSMRPTRDSMSSGSRKSKIFTPSLEYTNYAFPVGGAIVLQSNIISSPPDIELETFSSVANASYYFTFLVNIESIDQVYITNAISAFSGWPSDYNCLILRNATNGFRLGGMIRWISGTNVFDWIGTPTTIAVFTNVFEFNRTYKITYGTANNISSSNGMLVYVNDVLIGTGPWTQRASAVRWGLMNQVGVTGRIDALRQHETLAEASGYPSQTTNMLFRLTGFGASPLIMTNSDVLPRPIIWYRFQDTSSMSNTIANYGSYGWEANGFFNSITQIPQRSSGRMSWNAVPTARRRPLGIGQSNIDKRWLHSSNFTIAANWQCQSSYRELIGTHWDSSTAVNPAFWMVRYYSPPDGVEFWRQTNTGAGNFSYIRSTNTIPTTKNGHWCLTVTNDVATMYLNSTQVVTGTMPIPFTSLDTNHIWIMYQIQTQESMPGLLDDIKIYDRCLNSNQVLELYKRDATYGQGNI